MSPVPSDFTATSSSAFSGYRWPAEVILTAVRWYASYPLSTTHVMQLLAERHIDVSARTVLTWVQTFGPQLTKALHSYRRQWGRRWYVDEVFCFRGKQKCYLYRAVDQHGQVVDILLRDKRDRASAIAFFRRALRRTGRSPHTVIRVPPAGGRFAE
jgi:transposase-like protein